VIRHCRALLAALLLAAPCAAHSGPPYPILVDEPFGDRTVSIWADPDVGVGTFYLYIPEEEDASPDDPTISVWVRPADGRLPEVRHDAVRADADQPYQRVIKSEFDQRGLWFARFTIEADGPVDTLEYDIDVTPPGTGGLELFWLLSPFLVIAFFWAKALQHRRAYARTHS